jgi:lysophospholipase L1-like esterase
VARLAEQVFLALAGASLGHGIATVAERLHASGAPEGWTLRRPTVPVFAAVEQPLGEGLGWPLLDHGELVGPPGADRVTAVVQVPPGGTLEVGVQLQSGPAGVHLGRQGTPAARAFQRNGPRGRWLDCDGTLPSVDDRPVEVSVRAEPAALRVSVAGTAVRCAIGPGRPRSAFLRAGLLRTRVLSLDGRDAPGPSAPLRALAVGIGATLAVLLGRLTARRGIHGAVLALAPLVLVTPLTGLDARAVLQSLRVQAQEPRIWLMSAPLALSCALLSGLLVLRGARADRPARSVGFGAGVAAVLAALARPESPFAVGAAAAVGLLLATVVVVNVRRPPGFNAMSLALCALTLVAAEAGLRATATGRSWAGIPSREEGALRQEYAALTVERTYTTYPSRGYPVEPRPRGSGTRIVALGGSSTGGAFQNDDLDQFWPALVERRLRSQGADVEVVNQGVGGWTTLHIRRYVEAALEAVDPDVAVLYVGHNDRFTPSPVPYATLFGAWEDRPAARASRLLSDVRLYQGLRFLVSTLTGRGAGVAVPLEHARDNVHAIVARLRAAGARVLLVREAVAIGGDLLHPYGQMLCDVGASGSGSPGGPSSPDTDVACLDAAGPLEDPLAGRMFLDNVHLNPAGHERLSELVADALAQRGWILR